MRTKNCRLQKKFSVATGYDYIVALLPCSDTSVLRLYIISLWPRPNIADGFSGSIVRYFIIASNVNCFICEEIVDGKDRVVVKEKGLEIFRLSRVKRNDVKLIS